MIPRAAHAPRMRPMTTIHRSRPMPRMLSSRRPYSVSNLTLQVNQAREKVVQTYGYVTKNLATTAASAAICYQTGVAEMVVDLGSDHPIILLGTFCIATIPSLIVALETDVDKKPFLKHTAMATFNASIGALLSPMCALGPQVLVPATAMTLGVTGALALAAKMAKTDLDMQYRHPLNVARGAVVAVGVAGLAFGGPLGSIGYNAIFWGGGAVAVASLTANLQRLIRKAHEPDYVPFDEAILLGLDFINIWQRVTEFRARRESDTYYDALPKFLDEKVEEKIATQRRLDTMSYPISDDLSHRHRHNERLAVISHDSDTIDSSDASSISSGGGDGGGIDIDW